MDAFAAGETDAFGKEITNKFPNWRHSAHCYARLMLFDARKLSGKAQKQKQ
jgi:hypothetical protein